MSFGLAPSYGLLTARDVHEWFLEMMREHDEFEVDTDRVGPLSFWSETVRRVVVAGFGVRPSNATTASCNPSSTYARAPRNPSKNTR